MIMYLSFGMIFIYFLVFLNLQFNLSEKFVTAEQYEITDLIMSHRDHSN